VSCQGERSGAPVRFNRFCERRWRFRHPMNYAVNTLSQESRSKGSPWWRGTPSPPTWAPRVCRGARAERLVRVPDGLDTRQVAAEAQSLLEGRQTTGKLPRSVSVGSLHWPRRYCAAHILDDSSVETAQPGGSPRRGGGPPLSVGYPRRALGCAGRVERWPQSPQVRGPSPRTKRSGGWCDPNSGPRSVLDVGGNRNADIVR
jgi:hypothetical protein